ncbi:MAG: phosphopantothenoylcysteine decarboxylase, partial [Muribaculaceae bacterium]|nr:phosphopantothenoylcysteine decarboxylase [Muribaculaceae bacterium]
TYEKIDPVRFIGNYSSGKMGFALAEECASRGAEVVAVSGPVANYPSNPRIKIVKVESAQEMNQAAIEEFAKADIGILAAAVADYRPEMYCDHKIKREGKDEMTIHLVKNPDIAYNVCKDKRPDQTIVGFALETDNALVNAESKLKKKNLDMIVLNSLEEKGAGFRCDTNKVTVITRNGDHTEYPLKSKKEVAADIIESIVKLNETDIDHR